MSMVINMTKLQTKMTTNESTVDRLGGRSELGVNVHKLMTRTIHWQEPQSPPIPMTLKTKTALASPLTPAAHPLRPLPSRNVQRRPLRAADRSSRNARRRAVGGVTGQGQAGPVSCGVTFTRWMTTIEAPSAACAPPAPPATSKFS